MELLEVIKTRYSVRDFLEKEIPEDILKEILEAGRLAPSCQNRQCWRYIVVRDKKKRYELALKSGFIGKVNFFIKKAPVIIVAVANPKHSCRLNEQDYYLVDIGISFQQMMLAAWNYSIGSCWLAAFNEKKVKKILNIPDKYRVVAISPFGYPKDKKSVYSNLVSAFANSRKRLPLEKIVRYNSWEKEEE